MKTHLIVLTSLDELRAKKDKLVQEFSDAGNLKRHGDDSVETNDDQVFFLKVITLSEYRSKLMQAIGRGYDYINLSSVIKEISYLLDSVDLTVKKYTDKELSKMPPGSLRGDIANGNMVGFGEGKPMSKEQYEKEIDDEQKTEVKKEVMAQEREEEETDEDGIVLGHKD